MRRVDQLIDSFFLLTDFEANFSKKVWVFVIEILGFFLPFGFKQDSWEFL